MIYLQLFWEFFKTGLFAVGGGLATIPFLTDMIDKYHWFTSSDLMNMIAVSESTPGPIGVNMATYVGYHVTGHIFGAITTTFGLVTPSVIVICIVAKFLQEFKEAQWVQDIFYGLRPAVTALIAVAGLGVFETTVTYSGKLVQSNPFSNINWLILGLMVIVFIINRVYKKINPILVIVACAVLGIVLQL